MSAMTSDLPLPVGSTSMAFISLFELKNATALSDACCWYSLSLLDDGNFGSYLANLFNDIVDDGGLGGLHYVVRTCRLEVNGNIGAVDGGIGLDLYLF